MEIRLDSPEGKLAGTITIPNTRDQFKTFTTSLSDAKGNHDLYFVFKGNNFQKRNLFNFDWWEVE